MSKQVNRHHKNVNYEVENIMFLNSKNIKTQRLSKKLNDKMLKSFKIVKKVRRAFQLKFSKTMLIHDVFHSSLLQKAVTNLLSEQKQTSSLLILINNQKK